MIEITVGGDKTIFGIAIDIKHTLECIDPTAAISARLDVFS
jgi:hypothetical protein